MVGEQSEWENILDKRPTSNDELGAENEKSGDCLTWPYLPESWCVCEKSRSNLATIAPGCTVRELEIRSFSPEKRKLGKERWTFFFSRTS